MNQFILCFTHRLLTIGIIDSNIVTICTDAVIVMMILTAAIRSTILAMHLSECGWHTVGYIPILVAAITVGMLLVRMVRVPLTTTLPPCG